MGSDAKSAKIKVPPTRPTPQILRDLRSLRVLAFHPRDQDGEQLTHQLQRIGCQVRAFWPPLMELPENTDVIFFAVRPDVIGLDLPWCADESTPPIIAVVTYENPTIVDAVLRLGAKGVVASPVRSFGLLSSLVLAREITIELKQQRKRVARLEERLTGIRKIAEAKAILMQQRGLLEDDAYKVIRDQAMTKRVTTEEIAGAIINANDILSFKR